MTEKLVRKMRWWIPTTLIALALGTIAYWRVAEQPFIEVLSFGIGLLTFLLLSAWYILLTGLPWRTRIALAGALACLLAGAFFGVKKLTRVDGSIGGSGVPRLVWKWAPPRDAGVQRLQVNAPAAKTTEPPSLTNGAAASYPQFLGHDRLATLSGPRLARDWRTSAPHLVWRQPIGLGWSSFAVEGNRALTQEQRQQDELVVCYELTTGRALWAHTNAVRFSESLGGDGPRATPTVHHGRVYAMGATGILDCLDLESGKPIWTREVLKENGLSNITWGKSCSPLLVNGLLVVTGGETKSKSLLAYDAENGGPAWQAGHDRASYASPCVITLDGVDQIAIVNGHSVTGHDLSDGSILWDYAWPGDFPKVTQPMSIATNRVLIAAGYGLGAVMLKIDRAEPKVWKVAELWKTRNLKPKFTNMVRRGDHLYALDDGILTCINLESGQREWKEGRYGHGQLLLVEDLLLVQAESGEIVLVEATPQAHRELSRFPAIQGKTWNNPVLVGDLLLVRNDQEAACYRLPLEAP